MISLSGPALVQIVGRFRQLVETSLSGVDPRQVGRVRHLALLWVLGNIVLGCVTWACFQLGLNFTTTAFAYLIVIVLLSLMDSLISSAIFSAIAVACLNFFFVEPLFTFRVEYAQDLTTLIAFLITSIIVTGLVRRTTHLGQAQREQARLLDLTRDAVVVRNMNDIVTYWNRGAEEVYGWKKREAIGKVAHQLLQTMFPAPLGEITDTLLRTGGWEGEVLHTKRDGTKVSVASRWTLQQGDSGHPLGILETNNDITERRRAEEALRRSQATYLAEAQKLSHTGSFGWNVSSGEIFWSEESFRIFGYDPTIRPSTELVLQRVHPDDAALVRQVIDRAATDKQDFEFEHRLLMPDGSIKHVHVVAHAANDEPDKLQFVGALMDTTVRKRAEEALRYSEYRYRNMFQAMAASFWELDFSGANEMVRDLLKSGVTDLRQHFTKNPAFVRDMMRATRVVDVNDQTVVLFGRGNRDELLGNVELFWPEESTHVFAEAYVQAAERKPNYSTECKLRRIDGSTFDGLFTVAYPPPEMGRGSTMVGVIDITVRKQSERALRASEQRYQNLFQAMAVSFWELDFSRVNDMLRGLRASGVSDLRRYFKENPAFIREIMRATRVVDVNDQTVALFGRGSKEELLATTEPLWPEESWPDYAEAILSSVEHNLKFSIETRLRRLDGSVFDAQFTVWYSAEDKTTGLAGVLDITERKQAYAAMEQSEQRYRHLFHHMPIPLLQINSSGLVALMAELREQGVTDLAGYMQTHPEFLRRAMDGAAVEQVNESAVRLLGARDAQELLGPVAPYWKDSPEVYERILLARFRGEEAYQEEMKVTTRDGRVVEGMFTVAFPPALAKLGITLNAFVDATEKNRAQARLQQVEADFAHAARVSMLGELTASIAHEVNQPLAAIATNGEAGLRWLDRPQPDVAEVRELTKRIVADARRAADVIARIRTMAARRVPEHTPLSLDEVIREALLFLRHEVQARGVTVSHYPALAAPNVLADRTQLQQVIVNLAVNAMQAMVQTGSGARKISIRTVASDAATLSCVIEDSGPGVASEHLVRLFESFFTTKDGGMGMGLPICRSIIEAHGGRITADNDSAYGGARFSFTLPAASKPH